MTTFSIFRRLILRHLILLMAGAVILGCGSPSHAAEKPRAPHADRNQLGKVWTNEDLDQLRSRGLISIVGPQAGATPSARAQSQPPSSTATRSAYTSRLEDPDWYAKKAADLQAELDDRTAALQQQQAALAQAADRITQPGVSMDQPNAGVTPDAGISVLEVQVQEVQNQLNELSDLARQHDIPPGVLGG